MAKGIVINISGSGEGAAEALRQIEAKMQETAHRGNEMSEQLAAAGERIRGAFEMVGLGLGFGELISKMKEAVSAAGEFGESISKANDRTGIAAGTLSVLHYAAAVTGTDFDKLVTGVSRMGKNMADVADGRAPQLATAFKRAGIDAKALVDRSDGLDIAFKKLSVTLASTEAPGRKNQIMMDLLGKAGSASIPVVQDLASNFEELKQKTIDAGVYLDQMSAEKLKNLNQKMADLKQRIEGAQVAFAEGLSPALQGVFSAFANATQGTNLWSEAGKQAGLTLIPLAYGLEAVSQYARETSDEFRNLKAAWAAFSSFSSYESLSINGVQTPLSKMNSDAHEQALKAMRDTKADHDAAEAEDKRFHDAMLAIKKQLENPSASALNTEAHHHDGKVFASEGRSRRGDNFVDEYAPGGSGARRDEEAANQRVAAKLRLTEAGENAQLEIAKSGSTLRLAQLNAEHAMGTVSTQNYLRQKLALVENESDQEAAALRQKRATLSAAITAEGKTDTPRKLELEAQLVALDAKLTAQANTRAGAEAQITAEMQNQAWAAQVKAAQQTIDERHRQQEMADRLMASQQRDAAPEEKLNVEGARAATQAAGSFFSQLTEGAIQGKISMKSLVNSAIMDLDRFAMKLLEERTLLPLMNSLFGIGGGGQNFIGNAQSEQKFTTIDTTGVTDLPFLAGGGDIDSGWAVVGDGGNGSGSELFAPKGPGTVLPHDVLEGLASAKGGGGAPNVTVNTINNSSNPVQQKQAGMSWDGQARQFVIHTVLEDMQSGGPMSAALQGFAPK